MGAPPLWQHVRQTVGRAVRETGQALDRTALRLESVAKTKFDFGDEPTRCMDHLSRHRQLFPLLAAGRPVLHPQVAYVAPCATLIGSVVVGRGASVWYGAVLRADTTAHAESFNKTDEELLHATTTPVLIASSSSSGEDNDDENATTTTMETENDQSKTDSMAPKALDKPRLQVSKGPFKLPDSERTPYSGGGIVIGEDTNIQDGCILTARKGHCLVGRGVTVGKWGSSSSCCLAKEEASTNAFKRLVPYSYSISNINLLLDTQKVTWPKYTAPLSVIFR